MKIIYQNGRDIVSFHKRRNSIVVEENCFCSHCGRLSPYDPVFYLDDKCLCLFCSSNFLKSSFTHAEKRKLLNMIKKAKLDYYNREITRINKLTIEDLGVD